MTIRLRTQDAPSYWPVSVKLKRLAWAPMQLFFLPGTTKRLSPLRRALLRLFGAQIHPTATILDGVRVWYPWNLTMHAHTALGYRCEVYNFAPVVLGEQATVSQYAYLCTASHDIRSLDMRLTYRPITIAAEAWVAAGAFIGPGVTVGQGAVVGARAVVMRDVEPWSVVAGNPARVVSHRSLAES